jgi:hypothetical protein
LVYRSPSGTAIANAAEVDRVWTAQADPADAGIAAGGLAQDGTAALDGRGVE